MAKRKIATWLIMRKLSQLFFVVFTIYMTFFYFSKPVAICWLDPFWHLQALFAMKFDVSSLSIHFIESSKAAKFEGIELNSFIYLLFFLALGILFGRIFCGWICPFGTFLEYLEKISPVINRWEMPSELRDPNLKYAVLVAFLILDFLVSQEAFCEFCPAGTLLKASTSHVVIMSVPVFLIVLILVSMYGRKVWCSYLCPLGALFALTSKVQIFPIKTKKEECVKCFLCDKSCPMDVPIVEKYVMEGKGIRDSECIKCMKCLSSCPKKVLKFP